MRTGRRGFFGLIAGLLAARWMPASAPVPALPRVDLMGINAVTKAAMLPAITDNFFANGPLLAMLKAKQNVKWEGAPIQQNFLYEPRNG